MKAKTVSVVHEDPFEAGLQAADELLFQLGKTPDFILMFVSAEIDAQRALDGFWKQMPSSARLVGCSSFAEIDSEEALSGSVTAMGVVLDEHLAVQVFHADPGSSVKESYEAGRAVGNQLKPFNPSLIIMFPDGIKARGTPLLVGLQDCLGQDIPIIGGLSAAPGDMSKSYELFDRSLLCGHIVGLALQGPVELVTAAKAGFSPVGVPKTITRVQEGRGILEFDGQPAARVYKDYLGDRAGEMPLVGLEFPLGVVGGPELSQRLEEGEAVQIVRAVVGIDESDGALLCLGELPAGAQVCMTRANKDEILKASNQAGEKALHQMPNPDMAFIFSCLGRKIVLGADYKDELAETFSKLSNVPKIGFYTYGELSPVQGISRHHHETFTIALLKVG